MEPRSSTGYELDRALKQPGCPICRVSQEGVHRYLDGLVYESVNDPGVREHVTLALGFCNRHAWEMSQLPGASLGLALLLRDSSKQWQKQLDAVGAPGGRAEDFAHQLAQASTPQRKCLACEQQSDIEHRFIETLLESLSDQAFTDALRGSSGLCRPHFVETCAAATGPSLLERLSTVQRAINQRLIGELDEFIRKNDYRFRGEGFGQEGDSWIRAIDHLSGRDDALC